jgi:hypothetical protein
MNKSPVIKGLQRLHYSDPQEEFHAARKSLYYLWWAYLRLSKDYWWVCQQQGETLDPKLHAVWRDFGNVFDGEFWSWWKNNGRSLFAEQMRLPHVRAIDPNEASLNAAEQHIVVEIPLNLTERTIARQVMALVRAHPSRQVMPVSRARRQLCKLRGVKAAVIRKAHDIWCANHLIELAKQPNSTIGAPLNRMSHYQIGIKLELVRNCMPKKYDGDDVARKKRNGMKVAVSRMIIRANALIANAEIGVFPSTAKLEPGERWSANQLAALNEAVSQGKWQPPSANVREVKQILDLSLLPS